MSPVFIMVLPPNPRLITSNLESSLSMSINYEGYDLDLGSEEHDPSVIESPTVMILVTPSFFGSIAGSVVFNNWWSVGTNANFEIIYYII